MLELKHVTKEFPGVRALDSVSLSFQLGEVHALLGENGAGKSTLMKIICGLYQNYSGQIVLDQSPRRFGSYQDALKSGISIVNQEIQVIPEASVAENIMLDKLTQFRGRLGKIHWKNLKEQARHYMTMVNLNLDPETPAGSLSAAQKQLSQIARTLASSASVILFDEPTSSITRHEAENLFSLMETLRNDGKTIVFVSHKLEEIFRISDRVSVIRDGQLVGSAAVSELDRETVVSWMIGRTLDTENRGSQTPGTGTVVLDVRNMHRAGKVNNVSFRLHQGEILGFYGLVGAGRTETARCLIGEDTMDSGTVFINGQQVDIRSVSDALYRYGIGYVTENRKEEGLWLDYTVETNTTLTIWNTILNTLTRYIRRQQQRSIAETMVGNLGIKTTGLSQHVKNLSGGNQQKVSIAKWLAADCRILVIDEPTVGVDVGAKEYIHQLVRQLASEQGKSIILISSDLPEMLKLAQRILVFRDGGIVGELDNLSGDLADSEKLNLDIGNLLV